MAKDEKKKVKTITGNTPAGVAVYPRLTEPDTKFDADGVYSLKLRLTAEESTGLIETITTVAEEAYAEALEAAVPKNKNKVKRATPSFEPEVDDEGKETGNILFNFKMKASGVSTKTGKTWTRKPVLFDAKGKPIINPDFQIWGGSIVRVAYELVPYNSPSFGCGCSQRLTAVQIIELREGGEKSAQEFGFGEEEGFSVDSRMPVKAASDSDEPDDSSDAADEGDF